MGEIIRFQPEPDTWMASSLTPDDAFSGDDQTERDHPFFALDDESVSTGVWECAPSVLEIDSYPVHEMMTILSGSVTITDHGSDRVETFVAGDTFFVSKGSRFTWEITETLRKYYFTVA